MIYEYLVLMLIVAILIFPVILAVTGLALLVRSVIRWFLREPWSEF